jgi:hypothetical protein
MYLDVRHNKKVTTKFVKNVAKLMILGEEKNVSK